MPALPRRLGHIWIGPKPAPVDWMRTWPARHPGWDYTVYDNDFLVGHPFRLRRQIDEYIWRGLYAGAQDMMRYEILYRWGGFMADADAVCLHPVDELLDAPRAYTVYDRPETDRFRGVCPILACEPGNPFVGAVIDRLAQVEPWELRKAEVSTGNRFLMSMIRELSPGPEQLHIWPTHYFVPWQKSDPDAYYDGPDTVYAEQKWATSTFAYNREGGPGEEVVSGAELERRRATLLARLVGAQRQPIAPDPARDAARHAAQAAARGRVAGVLASPGWQEEARALGATLEAAVRGADGPTTRFHGLHMFRHKQNDRLDGLRLRTRSGPIRDEILGWIGSARRALVLGLDTGHLALAALHLSPDLRITALDAMRWARDKEEAPPLAGRYVPVAADWLAARYPDRFFFTPGLEQEVLGDEEWWEERGDVFDLVALPEITPRSLAALARLRPRLSPDCILLCASTTGATGREMAQRLRLQGMAFAPLIEADHGRANGSLSVLRLRPVEA